MTRRILVATIKAGLIPGLLVPFLWISAVLIVTGHFPDWHVYPYYAISFFALMLGVAGCLVLGLPTLVCLEKLGFNRPIIAAALGSVLPLFVFALFGPIQARVDVLGAWPAYALLALVGAVCGFAASVFSKEKRS